MNNKLRQTLPTTVLAAVLGCLLSVSPATADQVIPDDLIVQSSLCVGFDCVNGESFGFDTLRLKENNTRINFTDTSTGTFPSNDWELTANDSASGGANRFSIRDVNAARDLFTVRAGAAANSIFVDSTGRVGFRTGTPVLDLHVNTSNTPALRLEQNNTGGFSPQTWDVAGNEANFFVRDVTGGSLLSLRIRPGAPTSSLDIQADGDVRLLGRNNSKQLILDSNDGPGNFGELTFQRAGADEWSFGDTDTNFYIFNYEGAHNHDELQISRASGDVTIQHDLTINGVCDDSDTAGGCDAVFDPSYKLPSLEEHAAEMWEHGYLPAIGPTPEGTNITFSVQKRHFAVLNELEKAHIYIDQLNTELKEKAAQFEAINRRLARLESLLLAAGKTSK